MNFFSRFDKFTRALVIFGLVAGTIYAGWGLIIDIRGGGLGAGTLFALTAILGMPLLFGAIGWVLDYINNLYTKL